MSWQPRGKHLIAGEWIGGTETFASCPVVGEPHHTANGGAAEVTAAARAAEQAFETYGYTTRADRAAFLNACADEIELRAEAITDIAQRETGLPEARLQGERGRTTAQLRLFAAHIAAGDYLDRRHDAALPDRQPLPRPDLKAVQRPFGPVAVFGASNFPLAFSTAGGDTASALAAGCPVVVKGHPAHPGTGEIVAEAIIAAIRKTGMPAGTFGLIQGNTPELSAALVQHPLITAVGFTGSLAAGRALFNLCAARPAPVPFYGELGSVNPMFLLPDAVARRGTEMAAGWTGSLTLGVGQFCTNPGVVIALDAAATDAFVEAAADALGGVDTQTMLTDGIAEAYRAGRDALAAEEGVQTMLDSAAAGRSGAPSLFVTTGEAWLAREALGREVFGPLGLVVRVADEQQMRAVARSLEGQLTCTLHMDDGDTELGQSLLPILERKASRILVNGFPTGVEVCDSMVHGGPYPASTSFGATSVGTLAIRRFLRPVCYQNVPAALLPVDLRSDDRLGG